MNCPQIDLYVCRINATPREPSGIFIEFDKLFQKFIWKCRESRIAKIIEKKKLEERTYTNS